MITIPFPSCEYSYSGEEKYCITKFGGGLFIKSEPQENEEYYELANELGYKQDVLAFCRERDLFHTLLAIESGSDKSWYLYHKAINKELTAEDIDERKMINGFLKLLNTNLTTNDLDLWMIESDIEFEEAKDKALCYRELLKKDSKEASLVYESC